MSKRKVLLTPQELADELKSGKWRKAKGQLAKRGNQRCCLGVACEKAELFYNPEDGLVNELYADQIPWLFDVVAITGKPHADEDELQTALANLNDRGRGWGKVIEILESLQIKRDGHLKGQVAIKCVPVKS